MTAKQHAPGTSLVRPEQHGAFASGGVHDGANVVHAHSEGPWNRSWTGGGQARASWVEAISREKPASSLRNRRRRASPDAFEIREPTGQYTRSNGQSPTIVCDVKPVTVFAVR